MSRADGFPVMLELYDAEGTPAFKLALEQKIQILTKEGDWVDMPAHKMTDYYEGTVLGVNDWYLAMNKFLQNKMVNGKRLAFLAFKKVDQQLEKAYLAWYPTEKPAESQPPAKTA